MRMMVSQKGFSVNLACQSNIADQYPNFAIQNSIIRNNCALTGLASSDRHNSLLVSFSSASMSRFVLLISFSSQSALSPASENILSTIQSRLSP